MRGMRTQWSYTSLSLSETPIILAPRALISLAPVTMSSNVESPGLITTTYTDESMRARGPCFSSPPAIPSACMYVSSLIFRAASAAMG